MPLLIIFAIFALITIASGAKIVKQYEKGVILRLGKYHSTADSGVTIIIPFLDSMIRVDMREKVTNVEPQKVITKDNVSVTVDAVIYYKVVDPVKAEFEVEDFDYAATTLAQTNLRNLIGDKTLDEILVSRDIINTNLREVLDEATNGWGVKVTRVEVQKIDPPVDITDAMSRQMKAEREKRAAILESEAVRQSQILEAEGRKQKDILEAEGFAQARLVRAKAEATAIQQVSEAAEKYFKGNAQKLKSLEVAGEVFTNNTKLIIPAGTDLVTVLGADGTDKVIPIKK